MKLQRFLSYNFFFWTCLLVLTAGTRPVLYKHCETTSFICPVHDLAEIGSNFGMGFGALSGIAWWATKENRYNPELWGKNKEKEKNSD